MNKIVQAVLALAAFMGLFCSNVFAQDKTQGRIHYEITYHVHAALKPDQLQYKDLIPENSVENAELVYKGQRLKTFFNDAFDKEQDGVATSIRVATADGSERYIDLEQKKIWWVDKAATPPVLVEKAFDPRPADEDVTLEEGGDTMEVLGYPCRQLIIRTKKKGKQTIWYTTALPLKTGSPMGVYTDKGVVMAVDSKFVSIKATGVEFVPVSDRELRLPEDMKVVQEKDHKKAN